MITELCDFHIHTAYRRGDDGSKEMTVAFIADYAQKHEYTEIGLTPHFGLETNGKYLCQIRREIEDLETDISVLLGVEANFVDCGKTIAIDESIRSQLDYIVGAADHFNWGRRRNASCDL